jgi:hypothetical protein
MASAISVFGPTLVGESANRLTYVLAWESLVDREVKWTGSLNGPEWVWVKSDSETGLADYRGYQQPTAHADGILGLS